MSLEISINELNGTIKALIVSMDALVKPSSAHFTDQAGVKRVRPNDPFYPEYDTHKQGEPSKEKLAAELAANQSIHTVESVTIAELKAVVNNPDELRIELQTLSSKMISNKVTTKDILRGIINTYGGALVLAKVPDKDLPELKAKILALGE